MVPHGGRIATPRAPRRAVIALSALAGALIAGTGGASPVGLLPVDVFWCATFAGSAAWIGTCVPRGVLVAAAMVAVVVSSGAGSAAASFLALAVGGLNAMRFHSSTRLAAITAGALATAVLAGGHAPGPLGGALAVGALVVTLVLAARRSLPASGRRAVARGLGVLTIGAGVAGAALLGGVVLASAHLDDAAAALQRGRVAAERGSSVEAAEAFGEAASAFRAARGPLGSLGWPSRGFPGLAQHRDSIDEITGTAAGLAEVASGLAGEVDADSVQVRGGAVDLVALERMRAPVGELLEASRELVAAVERARSLTLASPLASRVAAMGDDADAIAEDAALLADAVQELPPMLGSMGERRYLLLFTTPVEARNRFGFPGSYAFLTLDGGQIRFDGAGPIRDLFPPPGASVGEVPVEAEAYAGYGVAEAWQSVLVLPDLPTAAPIAARLQLAATGVPVDGVAIVGPRAAAEVVGILGSVDLPTVPIRLDRTNTAAFLARDQYFLVRTDAGQAQRRDVLVDLAEVVGERLASADLPRLTELQRAFGDVVALGEVALALPDREASGAVLLSRLGLDGGMPNPSDDLVHLGHLNAGGNKIDMHLQRHLDYAVTVQPDGLVDLDLRAVLRNGAPREGQPDYVIESADQVGVPPGTNRSTLLLYSRHRLTSLTVNGDPRGFATGLDGSYFVYQFAVDIPPGGTVQVLARLRSGSPASEEYRLRLLPNGLLEPDRTSVRIEYPSGLRVSEPELRVTKAQSVGGRR